jgi:ParB/RepB/Spo0J family partition protein
MMIQQIPIDLLIPHPANPNRMSEATFAKLCRNIQKTGLYEPVVVRPLGDKFQIINGHHRIRALKKLGIEKVPAVVWDMDDKSAMTMLASLNRLTGKDEPSQKSKLYNKLLENSLPKELAKILPVTAGQIVKLAGTKLPRIPQQACDMPEPLVFLLDKSQREIVEKALFSAFDKIPEGTKAQKKAVAITMIAENYCGAVEIRSTKSEKRNKYEL